MAAATGGFDLGSLVPKLPGAGLIDQLTNPWNWMNLASQAASLVNLFLYYRLHRQDPAVNGGTNVDVKVQNVPVIEERASAAVEMMTRPAAGGLIVHPGNTGAQSYKELVLKVRRRIHRYSVFIKHCVFTLKCLKYFLTLPVLLQRWCSTCHLVVQA